MPRLSRSEPDRLRLRQVKGSFGAKTLWLYREALAKAGAMEELFDLFDGS